MPGRKSLFSLFLYGASYMLILCRYGHTHWFNDLDFPGPVRVVSNPKGYPNELPSYRPDMVLTLSY